MMLYCLRFIILSIIPFHNLKIHLKTNWVTHDILHFIFTFEYDKYKSVTLIKALSFDSDFTHPQI